MTWLESFNCSSSATSSSRFAKSSPWGDYRWVLHYNKELFWSVERTLQADDVTDSTQGFSAVHLGAIVATLWVLMLNGIVGFQLLDDGTPQSLGLILVSATALFIGTGYIALDTAFGYSNEFEESLRDPHRNIGLYVLYQLAPLVFLVAFFVLETVLVLRVLGEKKPMRM